MNLQKPNLKDFLIDKWYLRDADSKYSFESGYVTKYKDMLLSSFVNVEYGLVPLCNI